MDIRGKVCGDCKKIKPHMELIDDEWYDIGDSGYCPEHGIECDYDAEACEYFEPEY